MWGDLLCSYFIIFSVSPDKIDVGFRNVNLFSIIFFIKLLTKNSVPAPPSSVEILDHPHESKIEIKENQEFHLECRVRNAKPAARIVWYRGNVELNIRKC